MKLLALVTLALLAGPAPAATVLEYAEAKSLADADEASLSPQQRSELRASQAALLASGTAACSTPVPDLSALVVVMELDAQGKVVRTWLQGNSPLAICLRKHAAARWLSVPPRAPFYASIEVSFTK
ncbi:hypothetical protein DT603_07080 [Pseudoxanthomonas gei]|uniref:Uncharacterized protein n=1 Tax=Pseudoxanthomonas gei TaxID=1383030 RepID=A0ABX0AHB3_9GAMM|nr:hypothetical protein [Pseudoxanthomonas gei]NDK38603.1 hypothetical protein [Pseudoxanthomonas gei]